MSQSTTDADAGEETEVLVSSSTGRLRGPKICHEKDENGDPCCNSAGQYRSVSPLVYPDRKQCEKEACWSDDVPESMEGKH